MCRADAITHLLTGAESPTDRDLIGRGGISPMSYAGTPLMSYEDWLKKLDPEGIGLPSSPAFAEAYRQYADRWRAENPGRRLS
jgi:hypothetical protein